MRSPVSGLRKYDAGGRVQTKPRRRHPGIVDCRRDVTGRVHSRRQLEPAIVEDLDELLQTFAGLGDHEIEITRHPARSEDDHRHATHENGLEPKSRQ